MNRSNPLLPFALIMFLGLVLITFLSLLGVVGTNEGANEEEQDPVKQLYQSRCGGCHGNELQGGLGGALNNLKLSKDEIESIIVNGKGKMAGGFLKGEDAKKVSEWLVNKSTPSSNENNSDEFAKVKDTYKSLCASCHGDKLQGGAGPALAKSSKSEDEMIKTILNGKGIMPKNLVDEPTAKELVKWIKTVE